MVGVRPISSGPAAVELERRRHLAGWVAREILPHEPRIRHWLARFRLSPDELDDLLQESYYRISQLDAVDHIAVPHAYFFSIARNTLLRRLKRQRIVPFESIAQIEGFCDESNASPEDMVGSRLAYERVLSLIQLLPERCRQIVELRKIEGWSQRELAEHFGMTEKAVEKQIWLGVRAVRTAWANAELAGEEHLEARDHSSAGNL